MTANTILVIWAVLFGLFYGVFVVFSVVVAGLARNAGARQTSAQNFWFISLWPYWVIREFRSRPHAPDPVISVGAYGFVIFTAALFGIIFSRFL